MPHSIQWTQDGEAFTVSTDGTVEDALTLMVNARAHAGRQVARAMAVELGRMATVLEKIVGGGEDEG